MNSRQATAFIDLDAVALNLERVRASAPSSKVMAVVKADAYGHGAVPVAKALSGADAFGVARVSEAMKLREAGIGQPVCLLEGVLDREELNLASVFELQVVVHSDYQLELMERAGARRPVWLKIDTGMGRLGYSLQAARSAVARLGHQSLQGLMTHLACAGNPQSGKTEIQIKEIRQLSKDLKEPRACTLSIANSAAILGMPASLADWVRPGLMLYGASPFDDLQPRDDLYPAMTFSAPTIAIQKLKRGDTTGYGGIYTASEDIRVAVVAVGYADGYPREIAQGAPVLIHGQRRKLVGHVSMDMICVRLEDEDIVHPGDRVILWGEGLAVEEIARLSNTVPYTLLTGVSSRVRRHHRKSNG